MKKVSLKQMEALAQSLYSEKKIKSMLNECGYKVLSRKVHSDMPGAVNDNRENTIATWVTQHQKSA